MIWPIALSIMGTVSLLIWLAILLHPARPWDAQPVGEEAAEPPAPPEWPAVAILVPARNEAGSLPQTLPHLLRQDYPGPFRVIVIDDRSEDDTADIARRLAAECAAEERFTVLQGKPIPEGWVGKVWALQQGVEFTISDSAEAPPPNMEEPFDRSASRRAGRHTAPDNVEGVPSPRSSLPAPRYVLLTDADIRHSAGSLRRLVAESEHSRLALNSRMARLRCVSPAEKLLIPPFVFFFNLLYPMRQVNRPEASMAGAAGGCVLLNVGALGDSGGFAAMKGALIDDCTLARQIKKPGAPLRLALSREDVTSLRAYDSLDAIWKMVSRSAFTELKYSWLRLVISQVGLLLTFVVPPALLLAGVVLLMLGTAGSVEVPLFWSALVALKGLLAWAVMAALYRPMTAFYGQSVFWASTLPLAGVLYGAMTLDSAWQYLRGSGVKWR
jgi:hopene-associated glycosyltransferase HpnB